MRPCVAVGPVLRDGVRDLAGVRLGDDGHERRELLLGGRASADVDPDVVVAMLDRHSGMFPCFFGGRLARLPRRARSALAIDTRVCAGSMMPSSSPRSAARKGEATL